MLKNLLIIFVCFAALFTFSAFSAKTENQPIVIVPIDGEIEEGLVHIVKRGIKTVKLNDAAALILHMDTYGGKLQAAEKIMQAIARVDVPTYTYVDTKAISAGALIAASTKYIYMAPQGQIGDAKLIQMSPIPLVGGAKEIDKSIEEKMYSAVRAIVRSACEKNNHPWPLFKAMMHEEYAISNLVEKGKLLTMTSNEAVTQKLAVAISPTLDDMIDHAGFASAQRIVIAPRSGEHLARFFSSMTISGILLLLGLGGLFIEIRTPGFGVPGIIGVICLSLFFWGHFTAHLTGWFPVAMFIIGFILLLLEIFVIPGFGVAGISGIIMMVLALILAMLDWTPGDWGNVPALNQLSQPIAVVALSFIGAIILLIIVAKFLPKTPGLSGVFLSKKMDKEHGYTTFSEEKFKHWLNKTGVAKTTLRPAGKALVEGKIIDVVSQGEFIDRDSRIKIVDVTSNHIIVEIDA